MPNTETLTQPPRKDLHVFYVLDTSGSMDGAKISALNHAMEECTQALSTVAKSNGDARLKIAVLEFNSGCKWITSNGPELMEDFEWEYLSAGGLTDIGSALKELDSKLSRHAFLDSMTGALIPVIIFMTDGYATDDYKSSLEQIRQNKWFKRATKIGFAIGEDADAKMIAEVVGNSEAVIKTTDLELFKRLMRFVTVTASMLQSQSHTTATSTEGADIVKKATEEIEGGNVEAAPPVPDPQPSDPDPVEEPEDWPAGNEEDDDW